jgi:anti-anti-sigma regulatory factor
MAQHGAGEPARAAGAARRRLTIGLAPRGASLRVVTAGTLDGEGASRLERYVDEVASRFEAAIELDMRAVTAIDPDGVRLLIGLRRRFRRRLRIVPSGEIAATVRSAVTRGERNRARQDHEPA